MVAEPLPWNDMGDCMPAAGRRSMRNSAKPAMTSNMMSKNWPKPSPKPSDDASQAKPKPAARPPSMAPQGREACCAAPAWLGRLAVLAFWLVAWLALRGACAGCAGVLRCITLVDCLPNDPPPPKRLAQASDAVNATVSAIITVKYFMLLALSCLQSKHHWHLMPTCSAVMPALRLCTSTCPKPASLSMPRRVSWSGCMRMDSAK